MNVLSDASSTLAASTTNEQVPESPGSVLFSTFSGLQAIWPQGPFFADIPRINMPKPCSKAQKRKQMRIQSSYMVLKNAGMLDRSNSFVPALKTGLRVLPGTGVVYWS